MSEIICIYFGYKMSKIIYLYIYQHIPKYNPTELYIYAGVLGFLIEKPVGLQKLG